MASYKDRFTGHALDLGFRLDHKGQPLPIVPVPDGAPGPLSAPRYGWVRLRTVDRRHRVDIRLDDDAPSMTPQLPRIEAVDIPWRMQRSWWSGQDRGALTVSAVMDGWPRTSIELDWQILESIAQPVGAGTATGLPAPVQLAGNVPGADRLWMLTGIDSGDAIWRNGYRVRQHLTLSFVQWLPLDRAEVSARRNPRSASGALKRRPQVTVRKGDTLSSIAAAELGSSKRWKDIAKLNPHVKGKKKRARTSPTDLKVGEKLKMPQD